MPLYQRLRPLSRKHIEKINQVIEQALLDSGKKLNDMDAIAVTYGPGLVGALLVGVSAAKAISFATGIPLVGVHHIEGHTAAVSSQELSFMFPITGSMKLWDIRETMRQARPMIRLRARLAWGIPEVRRLMRRRRRATPMQ